MKTINALLIEVCNIKVDQPVNCIGLSNSFKPNTLSYLADEKYADEINANENISVVICSEGLRAKLAPRIEAIVLEDPICAFWTIFNIHAKNRDGLPPSKIHPNAKIHSTAYVDPVDVFIGAGTTIAANATILSGSSIGSNCKIGANTVVGGDGFEHKKTSQGVISITHDGRAIIEDNVEICSMTNVAKGFSWRDTIIKKGTKIDSLVQVAHCVHIGERCLITASSEISGSVTIGDDCWLSPNCSIINGIIIGNDVVVGIGAVVRKPVKNGDVVAGNPARVISSAH